MRFPADGGIHAAAPSRCVLLPPVRSAFMTDRTLLNLPSNAETMIAEARAARVRAHVRTMLLRLQSSGEQSVDRKSEADDRKAEADE